MENIVRSIFTLLALVLLFACDDEKEDRKGWGTFSANINGTPWENFHPGGYEVIEGNKNSFSSGLPCSTSYSLGFGLVNEDKFKRFVLSIDKIPLQPGIYEIINRISYHCDDADPAYGEFMTITADGDVLEDEYNVVETEDNFLRIDSYDSRTKEIKGSFEVTFVIQYRSPASESPLPDTLRFTDAVFHTKIL
jgi:hypothetical protein